MALPPRFLNSVYDEYPDDDSIKEVFIHAKDLKPTNPSDRHVLLQWTNYKDQQDEWVTQIVQLTGQPGNYAYYSPVAKPRNLKTMQLNQIFSLGQFSRVQRDQILDIARHVVFVRTSTRNNCQVFMRDLLVGMVGARLLSQAMFEEINAGVPLIERVAEA